MLAPHPHRLSPSIGGAQLHVHQLARQFISRHQVRVAAQRDDPGGMWGRRVAPAHPRALLMPLFWNVLARTLVPVALVKWARGTWMRGRTQIERIGMPHGSDVL